MTEVLNPDWIGIHSVTHKRGQKIGLRLLSKKPVLSSGKVFVYNSILCGSEANTACLPPLADAYLYICQCYTRELSLKP